MDSKICDTCSYCGRICRVRVRELVSEVSLESDLDTAVYVCVCGGVVCVGVCIELIQLRQFPH